MNTVVLLAALALGSDVPEDIVQDRVDVQELHAFYDENGKLIFQQWIGWDFYREPVGHRVVAWSLAKDWGQIPQPNQGGFVSRWIDQEGVMRQVRSPSYRRTWTQHDREQEDRQILPTDQRRGLYKPRRPFSSEPASPPEPELEL